MVAGARVVQRWERHGGKLCGTDEQAQPSIRSSRCRLWRGDGTHLLHHVPRSLPAVLD